MSTVTAILSVVNNRVAKYAQFATQEEAEAHVARFAEHYPEAFVHPDGYTPDLWVDGGMVSRVAVVEDVTRADIAFKTIYRPNLFEQLNGLYVDADARQLDGLSDLQCDAVKAEVALLRKALKDAPQHVSAEPATTLKAREDAYVAHWKTAVVASVGRLATHSINGKALFSKVV